VSHVLPLDAHTSGYFSSTLDGILVDLFSRMGAGLSQFGSPLLHYPTVCAAPTVPPHGTLYPEGRLFQLICNPVQCDKWRPGSI
ncbi:hypothetical protein DSO57_1004256, partial [Entomophthora muscae]